MPHCSANWEHPSCVKCGLCNGTTEEPLSNPFMPMHWNLKYEVPSTILIVGEAPGGNEDLRGRPFVGKAGTMLRDSLKEGGIDPRTCAWTNAVRCRPPKNKLSSQTPIKLCHEFLVEDIELVQPDFILILGATALKSVLKMTGIKKQRRKEFKYTTAKGKTVKCIAALHPASVFYDMNMKESFEGDIAHFCRVYRGDGPIAKEYPIIHDASAEQIRRFHDELLTRKFPVVSSDLETNSVKP